MKKFVCCLLPLFALQLDSCTPTKVFSREALPKEPKDLTVVTGFKNQIVYDGGLLYDATSATYNSDKLPTTLNSLKATNPGSPINLNVISEYKYNEDNSLKSTIETTYGFDGGISDIKHQEEINIEYDDYKNPTKRTTINRDYSEGKVIKESIDLVQTSYDYDKNGNLLKFKNMTSFDGEMKNQVSKNFVYDEKQRLIGAKEKDWDEDFDNPDGYQKLVKESHIYEGRKITDTSETITKIEDEYKTTNETTKICEYDSNYNLIHKLSYDYNPTSPLDSTTTESFYEYNNKGLETYFRSYVTNKATTAISSFEYRITTYCGTNNDKINSQTLIRTQVNKFNDSNSNQSQYKNVYNHYDDKQRVIRQEINSETTDKKPKQQTFVFEY